MLTSMRPGIAYGVWGPERPVSRGTSSMVRTSRGRIGSAPTSKMKKRLVLSEAAQILVRSSVKPMWCASLPDEPTSTFPSTWP